MMQQLRIDAHQRQVGRHVEPDGVPLQRAARVVRGAGDRVAEVGRLDVEADRPGLDPRHVEQVGDEAVEPRRFRADRRDQFGGGAGGQLVRRGDDGGERGAQVVADRGEQRRAQPVAGAHRIDVAHFRLQPQPFQHQRRLVDQAAEQRQLIGAHGIAGTVAGDAQHRQDTLARLQRLEQPFGGGERPRTLSGGLSGVERPTRRRGVDGVQPVRRIAGGDDPQVGVGGGTEQDRLHPQQPAHVVADHLRRAIGIGDARDLAQETGQRGVGARAGGGQIGLRAHPRGQLAGRDRDAHQDEHRDDILGIVDAERADRRQKEEIVCQAGRKAGVQPGAQAVEAGRGHHRQQIQQRDIAKVEDVEQRAGRRGHARDHRAGHGIAGGRTPGAGTPRAALSGGRLRRHRQDVDGDVGRVADQPVDHRSVAPFEPARSPRLAQHQLGGTRIGQEALDALHDGRRRDGGDRAAQLRRQRHRGGDAGVLRIGEVRGARGFDEQRRPRAAQPVGDALGRADQPVGAGQFADRHDDAVTARPGAAQPQRAHVVQHPRIDRLRRAAQRQFAQRRQVRP